MSSKRINREEKKEFNHFPIKTLPKVFCVHVAFVLIKAETEVTSLSLFQSYSTNSSILCILTVKILIAFNYAYLINTPLVCSLRTFKPIEFELCFANCRTNGN